jgi:general secretion pathway protein G
MVTSTMNERIESGAPVSSPALLHGADAPTPVRTPAPHSVPRLQRGFTLIELIVVVTIVGILASVAVINIKNAQRKAREAALRDSLSKMRGAIDNFYADKQRYPANLEELVPNYLKSVPKDPITMNADWEEVMEEPDPDAPENTDAEGNAVAPGMSDVRSRAQGSTLDDIPYTEL